ncbi:response regulator transcription factor [Streptomyces netropsis]|uniref:DNA-binding NarL/FixJ family response regulator n=1 Tax=Streptomyces netropsis TaxID=55404 RepID=A0A7W7L7N6_STRNE|nr:response regulator transcription factor [Streptomyces netropsis]MBB4885162.1 DNA-binding NarL/FixJ family response regulator [Streptomyces netropsis]GGR27226.1 DNA-binding response regulator [Streptomyces netropsis]
MNRIACGTPALGGQLVVTTLVRDGVLQLGLRAVLATASVVSEVTHCENWDEVEVALRSSPVDIIFLHESDYSSDCGVPDDVRGLRPKVLLLLSDTGIDENILAGPFPPDGFLVQGELTATAVEDALQRMAGGEVPMPASLARVLLERASGPGRIRRRRDAALTGRENEVLLLLAEGLSNKQIARRLKISSHGAKRIVASLLLKLGAPNRTAAVVTAIQLGLITY